MSCTGSTSDRRPRLYFSTEDAIQPWLDRIGITREQADAKYLITIGSCPPRLADWRYGPRNMREARGCRR